MIRNWRKIAVRCGVIYERNPPLLSENSLPLIYNKTINSQSSMVLKAASSPSEA